MTGLHTFATAWPVRRSEKVGKVWKILKTILIILKMSSLTGTVIQPTMSWSWVRNSLYTPHPNNVSTGRSRLYSGDSWWQHLWPSTYHYHSCHGAETGTTASTIINGACTHAHHDNHNMQGQTHAEIPPDQSEIGHIMWDPKWILSDCTHCNWRSCVF